MVCLQLPHTIPSTWILNSVMMGVCVCVWIQLLRFLLIKYRVSCYSSSDACLYVYIFKWNWLELMFALMYTQGWRTEGVVFELKSLSMPTTLMCHMQQAVRHPRVYAGTNYCWRKMNWNNADILKYYYMYMVISEIACTRMYRESPVEKWLLVVE